MKLILLVIAFFYLPLGQKAEAPYAEIESAFVKKDAESIAKLGNDKLLISLLGKENVYSTQQSTQALKIFFDQHILQNFKFIFKGKENKEGSFAIATYSCKNESFRITFHFKMTESNYKIVRINIEKE